MYTRIMVAMDGSTSSRRALEEGLKMAGLCHARVSAVYVVDKSAVFTYPGRLDPNALIEADRRAGVAVLHDAERTIARAAVNGETELV